MKVTMDRMKNNCESYSMTQSCQMDVTWKITAWQVLLWAGNWACVGIVTC